MTALAVALALIALVALYPGRDPWARTRYVYPHERLAAYAARRGAIDDDPDLTRRWCRGVHVASVYAVGGRIITNPQHMLPKPQE